MKKVFLCEYIHPEAKKTLENQMEIIKDISLLPEADAVISRNLSINRNFLEKADKLKVVGIHGTGTDHVDFAETEKRGIEVFNVPGLNADSVAELIVALALDVSRKITRSAAMIQKSGSQSGNMLLLQGHELSGKTIGLIGAGTIALKAAKIFREGFGCRILGWSRSLTEERAGKLFFTFADSPLKVIREADIIVMGLALNKDTKLFIGEKELRQAKPGSIFINTARGGLVDEKALFRALTEGWIMGAASDVFEEEPVTCQNPLTALPNFVATPHIGANTEEALYRVGMAVAEGILDRL